MMTEIIKAEETPEQIADWAAYNSPEAVYEREYAEAQRQRQAAYQAEADPLFFKSQRNKATKQEWLDKVAEIDARFPYPEKPKKK